MLSYSRSRHPVTRSPCSDVNAQRTAVPVADARPVGGTSQCGTDVVGSYGQSSCTESCKNCFTSRIAISREVAGLGVGGAGTEVDWSRVVAEELMDAYGSEDMRSAVRDVGDAAISAPVVAAGDVGEDDSTGGAAEAAALTALILGVE